MIIIIIIIMITTIIITIIVPTCRSGAPAEHALRVRVRVDGYLQALGAGRCTDTWVALLV